MKRVLVICYYFPPCNGAPAWRPYSWAKNFHLHGIRPTILSRHWSGEENTWEDFIKENNTPPKIENHEHFDLISLPSKSMFINKLIEKHSFLGRICGNIYFLILAIFGRFNTEVDVYYAFKDYLKDHLKNNSYDAVLISSPPSNVLKLISIVKEYSRASVIIDFRDLWNNLLLTIDYKPHFKQRIWDFLYKKYYKIWLKDVDLITVINEPFKEVISSLTSSPVKLVHNGYESDIFSQLKRSTLTKFTFSVIGNIYPEQDISIMLGGLKIFLSNKSPNEVEVKFIGVSSIPSVAEKVKASVPSDFLVISGRVSKHDALQATLDTHVLSFCGWTGVRGMVSTKAFDYIASGNFVLIAPGDNDILDELIKECECGVSVFSVQDFVSELNSLFDDWKSNKLTNIQGNKEKIEYYSREKQAEVMARHILTTINLGKR